MKEENKTSVSQRSAFFPSVSPPVRLPDKRAANTNPPASAPRPSRLPAGIFPAAATFSMGGRSNNVTINFTSWYPTPPHSHIALARLGGHMRRHHVRSRRRRCAVREGGVRARQSVSHTKNFLRQLLSPLRTPFGTDGCPLPVDIADIPESKCQGYGDMDPRHGLLHETWAVALDTEMQDTLALQPRKKEGIKDSKYSRQARYPTRRGPRANFQVKK